MIQRRMQFSVIAVGVRAIFAVAAALLLAGNNPAQADTATESVTLAADAGGSPPPLPQVKDGKSSQPEACNENPHAVVSTGHYAYFGAYWDEADKNLVSNPCPPSVSVKSHPETDADGEETGNIIHEVTRSTSPINIGSTVLHVPGGADLELRADDLVAAAEWRFLYPDRVEDAEGNITSAGVPLGRVVEPTPEEAARGKETYYEVWTLPECPHDADEDPGSVDLCLGFSAGTLNPADWKGDIRFEFEAERQPGLDPENRGAVFMYEDDESGNDGPPTVIWDSFHVDTNQMTVDPGGYTHGNWAFTRPGTYVFSVQVKGHPKEGGPVQRTTKAETLTSVPRQYTFHVGLLADLSVTVPQVSNATPETGGTTTFGVRVSNAGPDAATDVKAEIALPAGLTYASTNSEHETSYDPDTGVWSVGDLASGAHADLALTVNVADGTHGILQTLTAEVYATEQIGTQAVRELDPRTGDNTVSSTVTPVAKPNVDPMFFVERSVAENVAPGSPVGEPIRVKDPDAGNTLTFNLTGDGAVDFTVSAVDGGAQIAVGPASLDYETLASYDLTLEVSDGLDTHGNTYPSVDDTLPVAINVTDVENEGVTATLRASPETLGVGGVATFTLTVGGLPEGEQPMGYGLDIYSGGSFAPTATTPAVIWEIDCDGSGGPANFVAGIQYRDEEGRVRKALSNRATVVWTGGSGQTTVCNVATGGN